MEKLPRRIEKRKLPPKSALTSALFRAGLCLTLQFSTPADLSTNYPQEQHLPAKSYSRILQTTLAQPEMKLHKPIPPETATQTPKASEPDLPTQIVPIEEETPMVDPTPMPILTPEPLPSYILNPQNPDEIMAMIIYYGNKYGINPTWLIELARCESTFQPGVTGTGGKGVFQFADGTFDYAISFIPLEEKPTREYWDIFLARDNTLAAVVYIPRVNIYKEWGCAATADFKSKRWWYS